MIFVVYGGLFAVAGVGVVLVAVGYVTYHKVLDGLVTEGLEVGVKEME